MPDYLFRPPPSPMPREALGWKMFNVALTSTKSRHYKGVQLFTFVDKNGSWARVHPSRLNELYIRVDPEAESNA